MPDGIQQSIKIETPSSGFLGMDSASEPTSLDIARSRRLYNAYQGKIRALTQRPGSVPVTTTALGSPIIHLTKYPYTTPDQLLATSGTTLYKLVTDVLTPVTMTNALASADITDADFTGVKAGVLVNIKVIGDGGILKQYDGIEVKDVVPAADDTTGPTNVLTDINAKGCKFVWGHSRYVFISPGTNEVFFSKRSGEAGVDSQYDYFPDVSYGLLVRNGDYVNGCGVPFDSVQFIPMRNGWNVWSGTDFTNFEFSDYLNTINGVIAPKSIDIITYSTGTQTIAFLSDDGVHEIFSSTIDTQGRQYATRNLMTDKVDFQGYGFTVSEKEAAVSKYVVQYSMYLLEISRDGTPIILGYDTRNAEWYAWTGLTINAFIENDGLVYFAGSDGHLKQFDKELNDDWTNLAKTTGAPIDFDRISGMIWFEQTGYPSTLDYYILRLKTYAAIASLDISIIYLYSLVEVQEAIQNSFLTWDVSEWDASTWANLGYTDLVNAPQRLSHRLFLPKKGYYFQIRWRNNRSEPVEVYGESLIGRSSGEM